MRNLNRQDGEFAVALSSIESFDFIVQKTAMPPPPPPPPMMAHPTGAVSRPSALWADAQLDMARCAHQRALDIIQTESRLYRAAYYNYNRRI